MHQFELESASLTALFDIIEARPFPDRSLFRGQSDSSWGLTPSIYRLPAPTMPDVPIKDAYDHLEGTCIQRFFDEAVPYLQLPAFQRSRSNDKILAQHFGAPTSLLDWSTDPLVATYFAVENWEKNVDAALFMILPEGTFKPEDVRSPRPEQVIALIPAAIDKRIPAQRSVFTYHPYGPAADPFVPIDRRENAGAVVSGDGQSERAFAKVTIPAAFRKPLFRTLHKFGIDRRNLFPGLDGVGDALHRACKAGLVD